MQEEVENRTLTLVVSGTKCTGRLLKAAISKYLAHRKEKKLQKQRSRDAPVTPHGKQTVKPVSYTHLDVYKRQHEYTDYCHSQPKRWCRQNNHLCQSWNWSGAVREESPSD